MEIKMMMKRIFKLFLLVSITANPVWSATEVLNDLELRQKLNVQRYLSSPGIRNLKIAILDNGFMGFEPNRGMLPDSAEMLDLTQISQAPTSHGLAMAQTIWALMGKTTDGPKFYLINTNGYSNLKAAIQHVIDHKVDIVLYSQNWSFGSNFDGRGFINSQVSRAVDQGVLWINSAGNNHNMVRNASIAAANRGGEYLQFGSSDRLKFENRLDENGVTVTLSWTDFRESDQYNTNKDLDLFVYDANGNLVGSSELVQKGQAPDDENPTLSSHAREQVKLTNLDRGNYTIAVKAKSSNFGNYDKLRVLLFSEKFAAIDFKDRSFDGEIMPPADHPRVITVGDLSGISAEGPTLDGRIKPDVWLEEIPVQFSNGSEMRGSSSAAALLVGSVALIKAQQSQYGLTELQAYLERLKSSSNLIEPSLKPDTQQSLDFNTRALLPPGATVMRHLKGYLVVLTPNDPLNYPAIVQSGAVRSRAGDLLVLSPRDRRWLSYPPSSISQIVSPLVVFKTGRSAGQPAQNGRAIWKMP